LVVELQRSVLDRAPEVDLELQPAITAQPGDDAADARRRALADPFPYLLLVDADDRPIGWVNQDDISEDGTLTAAMAVAMSPIFEPRTTLKDALSMLLSADVMAGVVVDEPRRAIGLVTLDAIAAALRDEPGRGT